MLKAIIFDLDGVLIDTEPIKCKSYAEALKQFNVPNEEVEWVYKLNVGKSRQKMCEGFLEVLDKAYNLKAKLRIRAKLIAYQLKEKGFEFKSQFIFPIKNDIDGQAWLAHQRYREQYGNDPKYWPEWLVLSFERWKHYNKKEAKPISTAVNLVKKLQSLKTQKQIKIGLVTESEEKLAQGYLEICGLIPIEYYFDETLYKEGSKVEMYKTLLNRWEIKEASYCIAIEDSVEGFEAARKANLPCLVVPTKFTKGRFENIPEIIIEGVKISNLSDLTKLLLRDKNAK